MIITAGLDVRRDLPGFNQPGETRCRAHLLDLGCFGCVSSTDSTNLDRWLIFSSVFSNLVQLFAQVEQEMVS